MPHCVALGPRVQSAQASSRPKKVKKDPWALEQIAKKRAVHEARKKVLKEERESLIGDPVRGTTTAFLESFDNVGGAAIKKNITKIDPTTFQADTSHYPALNYYLTPDSLAKAIKSASELAKPSTDHKPTDDPEDIRTAQENYERGHLNAVKALPIITSLANASSKEKTRVNIQRCIETFGRHRTDRFLPPKLKANPMFRQSLEPRLVLHRAGKDTGSSEVQIAILTAKIRRLADELEKDGAKTNDKHGKRHVRLMVHRRQKLLQYLRREDRGGPRWQRVTEMLGLDDAAWKGEITL